MVIKIVKGIMENIDMPGFVFYPGYGMVLILPELAVIKINFNFSLIFVQDSGIQRPDVNKLEYRRIGKHTLSKMPDLRQAVSS